MRQRLAILGDVHGNARALRAALARVREASPDGVVFLGDLLSYGPDVDEVLDLVAGAVADGARLVLGNHDLLYRDLLQGERSYRDRLPPWLGETVDHTFAQLAAGPPERLLDLPFERAITLGPLYIAHANPFGDEVLPRSGPFTVSGAGAERTVPDWRYLNHAEDYSLAAAALQARGVWAGMFGHTHRPRIVRWPAATGVHDEVCPALVGFRPEHEDDTLVLNAGSVGQPRNLAGRSTVCCVTLGGLEDPLDVEIETLEYDVAGHLAAVAALPLSKTARDRLAAFFVRAGTPG
ncbi:MAG: metallophosphoesterase family protein [Myxococcota bacterium]